MSGVRLAAAGGSVVGTREENDDRLLLAARLVAVSDGAGGTPRGGAAAETAIAAAAFHHAQLGRELVLSDLVEAVEHAHEQVLASLAGSGLGQATLTLAAFTDTDTHELRLDMAWVGDTLLYGTTREIMAITEQQLHDRDAYRTRIGGRWKKVGIASTILTPGARVLIATDGLSCVPHDDVLVALQESPSATECVRVLLDVAVRRATDNVTAAVVDVLPSAPPPPP